MSHSLKSSLSTTQPSPHLQNATIDFDNSASAHGTKSTLELLRAILVFESCLRLPSLVQHADKLLQLSNKLLGKTITNTVVKHTFFRHFCAGENSADMKPVIEKLRQCNIGAILDYAAESDDDSKNGPKGNDHNYNINSSGSSKGSTSKINHRIDEASSTSKQGDIIVQPPFNQPARIYDYKSESECDQHVSIFKECIRSVRDVSNSPPPGGGGGGDDDGGGGGGGGGEGGFAALKVTALGNPKLLERMSTMIVEVKNLFSKFDEHGNGLVTQEDFIRCYGRYFNEDQEHLDAIIGVLDPSQTNDMIDYISFSQMITPYTLSTYTLKCKDVGPLAQVTPSDEEVVLMKRMSERLHILAEEAAICGTKLLIDAEHTKYQPAIDNLVLELKQKYNAKIRTSRPVIFNTYQCYLKDARERIMTDLQRSERFGFHFAAKLVRGAYMIHERERARELNRPSPIHDSAFDTHACYDEVIELLLKHRHLNGQGLEIMIATHNKESIQKAVHLMNDLNLGPNDNSVHFAQLYGMSDNLTFTLGKHGYNAYKYLPYGEVQQVIPYLVRRAQENGDVLGKAKSEVVLLREELKERFLLA